MTMARWLLTEPDRHLPTGDTVGRPAEEKVTVQRVPSPTGDAPEVRGVCNSGVAPTPTIDGTEHHIRALAGTHRTAGRRRKLNHRRGLVVDAAFDPVRIGTDRDLLPSCEHLEFLRGQRLVQPEAARLQAGCDGAHALQQALGRLPRKNGHLRARG